MTSGWAAMILRELRVNVRGNLRRERCRSVLGAVAIILWSILFPHAVSLADRWHLAFVAVASIAAALFLFAGLRHIKGMLGEEIHHGTLEPLLAAKITIPEIVIGGFIAKFVRALFELLPAVPILLLCATMNGRPMGEFWRVMMALTAILFTSLSLATLAGSLARDNWQALRSTALFLCVITLWLPLAGLIRNSSPKPAHNSFLILASPAAVFHNALETAFQRSPSSFRQSLLLQLFLASGALLIACLVLHQRFRSRPLSRIPRDPFPVGWGWLENLMAYLPRIKLSFFKSRVVRPIYAWALPLLFVGAASAIVFSLIKGDRASCEGPLKAFYGVHLSLKICLALEAATILGMARFRGHLLLELATPIDAAESLARYKKLVCRSFRWPFLFLCLAHGVILATVAWQPHSPLVIEEKLAIVVVLVLGLLEAFTDGYGLLWLGMWSGLIAMEPGRALAQTLGRIVFLPWAILGILALPNLGLALTMNEDAAYFICWTILGISLSTISGASSKNRLHNELRNRIQVP